MDSLYRVVNDYCQDEVEIIKYDILRETDSSYFIKPH